MNTDTCAGAAVTASRVKPWVLFVVDRSGSTDGAFPGSTSRWQALYDSLMAQPDGLIFKLQSVAYFGMVLFDGGEENVGAWANVVTDWMCIFDPSLCADAGTAGADGGAPVAACPRLIPIDPKLNNYNDINTAYQAAGPGGSTPTALALDSAYQMVSTAATAPDVDSGPQYVILCTDGEPNGCASSGWGMTDYQGPIDEVTQAAAAGIKTFVIGIAVEAQAQAHLDQLAQIGATGAPAFSPTTKDDLVQKLTEIMGGSVGCQVKLNGTVTAGQECSGRVLLNGVERECNGADGWRLADESHIELQGAACTEFLNMSDAVLEAGFPCGVFEIE